MWAENDTSASHCGFACVRESGCSSKVLDTYDKKCDRLIFLKGRASNSRLNKKENLIHSNLSPPPVCLAVTWFKLLGLGKLSFVKGMCGFLIKPLSCVILSLHGCCWLVQFLSFFFFFLGVIKRYYHRDIRELIFPGFSCYPWICYEEMWEGMRNQNFSLGQDTSWILPDSFTLRKILSTWRQN